MEKSLSLIDWLVILFYFASMIAIGVWTSYRVKTNKDFFVAGHKLPKFITVMLGFASSTNTDQAVAVAAQSYRTGMSGVWFQWLYLFGQCTGYLIAPLCRRARTVTQAEFFALRYSRNYALFYSFLGLIILSVNIGWVLYGSGVVFSSMVTFPVPMWVPIGVTALVFIIYSVIGGMEAAALTEAIQGMLTIVLSFILIPFILAKVGGMSGLHQVVEPARWNLAAPHEMTVFVIAIFSLQAVIGHAGGAPRAPLLRRRQG